MTLGRPLPLLVTIGPPLGLQTIVYQRLNPQLPTYPPQGRRWGNGAAANDVVAARVGLGGCVAGVRAGALFVSQRTVNNGREAHRAAPYLTAKVVGKPVGETLAG